VERADLPSEEGKPDGPRARGETEELLVNDRAANSERASLRRSANASPKGGEVISGSRSSAESAPRNQEAHLPEGRGASWLVQPGLDLRGGQAMGRARAGIRLSDTAEPAPDEGRFGDLRSLVAGGDGTVRMDPSGLIGLTLPPKRRGQPSESAEPPKRRDQLVKSAQPPRWRCRLS